MFWSDLHTYTFTCAHARTHTRTHYKLQTRIDQTYWLQMFLHFSLLLGMCGIGTIETCLQPFRYLEADNNVVSVTSRTARGHSVSLKTSNGSSCTWKNLSNIAERFWLAIWRVFPLTFPGVKMTHCELPVQKKMFNQLQLIEFSWWNYKSITNQLLTFHMYPHGGMYVKWDGNTFFNVNELWIRITPDELHAIQ